MRLLANCGDIMGNFSGSHEEKWAENKGGDFFFFSLMTVKSENCTCCSVLFCSRANPQPAFGARHAQRSDSHERRDRPSVCALELHGAACQDQGERIA
jgi:hypothetical protein